jgi:AAA ATPase domain
MAAFELKGEAVVKHSNPFRPGSIITPGMFCGRLDELLIVERILFQTKHGNSGHFLIHGERGIGKSSLLLYLQYVATGSIKSIDGQTFTFLVLPLELEPTTTYTSLIKKVGAEFQRQLASQQRFKDTLANAWDFLKRWEVMGVKYSEVGVDPDALLDDLVHTVHTALLELTGKLDGVLVLIDEADKPSAVVANLGTFAKLFTERLSKRVAVILHSALQA